ncbi:kelch domain-containing protein 8B isoform X2 [Narcine bancroftii]|uniref:kelch domain-containing protein 8B isoform X2 n=1 Tax=Narcine bancroftii TaxID=1343680 RepID=UPI0038315043
MLFAFSAVQGLKVLSVIVEFVGSFMFAVHRRSNEVRSIYKTSYIEGDQHPICLRCRSHGSKVETQIFWVDDRVYALGGMGCDAAPQALVRVYDPARDHWQHFPPMLTPQYAASAFLKGNKIFVLGGRQGKLPVTAFEALDLETKSWTKYPSIPSRRAFASCAMSEKYFYSMGGLQQPGPHNFYSRPHFVNTVEEFDMEQGNWLKQSRSTRMREKRADFSVGHVGGRVIAAGGLGNQPVPLGSVEGFNPIKRKWESLPAMNSPRCSCASLQLNNMLFVIGGVAQGPSNAVEALCDRESI